ncbi:MAG TPA: glycosyltransferase family 2 protein [Solirubrobacteraceae bacterium]|jgi:glycosyltransferase involved in cell wall biosynthesis|nr:glycosyltransferase family 2 protein [Solirubrobacteraceae bacterium]
MPKTFPQLDASVLHTLPEPPPVVRTRNPILTAVVPTLNEARNVAPVLQGLPECVAEIVVVDGRSDDGTPNTCLAADPRVRIIMERRRGKGAAMLAGFAAARGDAIVCLDADGSMDPSEVTVFHALLAQGYDLVKGSREAVGGGSTDFSPLRRAGNASLTRLANVMHRISWSDMCYGYFAFWRDVLPDLGMERASLTTRALASELGSEGSARGEGGGLSYGDGFEIETALFLRAARARLSIAESPSRELPRTTGESNLRTFRDGLRVLSAIGRERMRSSAPVLPL